MVEFQFYKDHCGWKVIYNCLRKSHPNIRLTKMHSSGSKGWFDKSCLSPTRQFIPVAYLSRATTKLLGLECIVLWFRPLLLQSSLLQPSCVPDILSNSFSKHALMVHTLLPFIFCLDFPCIVFFLNNLWLSTWFLSSDFHLIFGNVWKLSRVIA